LGDISINPFIEDMIFGEYGFPVKTPGMKISYTVRKSKIREGRSYQPCARLVHPFRADKGIGVMDSGNT
jgi:hypothetical protein